jgi:hypothetical protein
VVSELIRARPRSLCPCHSSAAQQGKEVRAGRVHRAVLATVPGPADAGVLPRPFEDGPVGNMRHHEPGQLGDEFQPSLAWPVCGYRLTGKADPWLEKIVHHGSAAIIRGDRKVLLCWSATDSRVMVSLLLRAADIRCSTAVPRQSNAQRGAAGTPRRDGPGAADPFTHRVIGRQASAGSGGS